MRRLFLKNVSVALPMTLGGNVPEPPNGYAFLTDNNGVYLTDGAGNYLVVPHG